MDQEVGGSSPPSCTSKINNLADSAAVEQIVVSALCPHLHCRTRRPDGAYGSIPSRLFTCAEKGNGIHA